MEYVVGQVREGPDPGFPEMGAGWGTAQGVSGSRWIRGARLNPPPLNQDTPVAGRVRRFLR